MDYCLGKLSNGFSIELHKGNIGTNIGISLKKLTQTTTQRERPEIQLATETNVSNISMLSMSISVVHLDYFFWNKL